MRRSVRAGLVTGAAVLALALAACGGSPEEQATTPKAQVTTVRVADEPIRLTDDLPGRVVAYRVSEIRPQVGGIIQRRLFTEGGEVRAGQPLFEINPAPFRADAQSAQASLRRAEAIRDNARLQLTRLETLVKIDAVSRQVYDDGVGALAQAEAEVGVAQAGLSRRQLDVGFATITAPISGRIGAASVTEGALVGASDPKPLATVQQIDRVYVDVSQPAARFEALRGQGDAGDQTVELLDSNGARLGLSGRLLFSEVSVDPGTGDLTARILVENPGERLLPGMFIRARLPRGPVQTLPRVPQQAIGFAGGKAQAIVVGAGGKAEVRAVRVGDVVDGRYVVLDGLRAGETVVVEGRAQVTPGAVVSASPWKPAPAPAQRKN